MKTQRILFASATILPLAILTGCSTLGNVLGGAGYPNGPTTSQVSDIQGTVNNIDTRTGRIDLSSSYVNGQPSSQNNWSVYYDSRTRVTDGNRTYSVTNLQRGDSVDVRVYDNGNGQYRADTISLLGGSGNA